MEKLYSSKKKWLIDVPVALNFFIRPYELSQTFAVIRKARPSVLFLIADGPREKSHSDVENVKECRKIVEDIDWDCKVYKFYNDENKGLFKTYFSAMDKVFEIVDRCIFLEDDLVVSFSFFEFCKQLLDKYENDLRVHYITGMNLLGNYTEPDGDYFFSGEGSIWGYATWKRTYISQNLNYAHNSYAMDRIIQVSNQIKPGYRKKIVGYAKNPEYEGHIPHPEFYKNFLRFAQNQIHIVPSKNMVCNIGACGGAVHSADSLKKLPKASQKLFYMKTYEYEFPLKDPEFVVRDLKYELYVNRMLAWNSPSRMFSRKIESLVRHLVYGDFKRIVQKFISVFKKNDKA